MPTITIKNEPHEVTQEVKDYVQEQYDMALTNYNAVLELRERVADLEHLIREWKLKAHTAKNHSTCHTRMAAHDAKVRLMESVGAEVVQGLLM